MKAIDFWFDPVSPYAYLAFERLPRAFEGLSHAVAYRPVLFGAMLAHHAHKGPAEIEPKRAWTFRQAHWLGHRLGIAIDTPARHPFNPLALSRLAWACARPGATPSRHVCETILRHVWLGGEDAEEVTRTNALRHRLAPALDPASDDVKQALRQATDEAIARGVFGVPSLGIDGKVFWGLDALDMAAAWLRADPWFAAPHWDREGQPRPGSRRGVGQGNT